MPLKSMMLYSCPICGNTLCGIEWEEHTGNGNKEYCCPSCGGGLNEDELVSEE